MAFLHLGASISPTKEELLAAWVPTQPWGGADPTKVGAFRLDDPGGEVGIETFLVRTDDGGTRQVPVTYRGAPLDGVAPITTMEHTTLGRRWVYDGCTDPVYVAALLDLLLAGGTQGEEEFEQDGVRQVRPANTVLTGSGIPGTALPALGPLAPVSDATTTTFAVGDLRVVLARVVPLAHVTGATLTGTWTGQDQPVVLAAVQSS